MTQADTPSVIPDECAGEIDLCRSLQEPERRLT